MRAFDWSQTPLGPLSEWPQSLRSAISICTGSRFPMAIYWGRELTLLYNDAWSPIAGDKHPWALGRGAAEVWPEIWETIAPRFQQVLATGESTYLEDGLLLMHRHGYTEECYFNDSFSAIIGEGGVVDGIFNAVVETTLRVISERRTALLRELGERIGGLHSVDEACVATARLMAGDGRDAPFCLVYVVDEEAQTARLAASSGVEEGSPAAPAAIPLDPRGVALWPLAALMHSRDIEVVTGLPARGVSVAGRPWPEAVDAALIAPCAAGSGGRASAFLIAGASPRRAIDDEYRQFVARAASHLALALSAGAGEEARIQGVQSGADDYLVKPFASRELVARVNAQMRLARGARERQELLAREREADLQKQHLYSLFMQAPLAIVVLRGPEYLIELANPFVCGIWGRRHRDVINRPLFEALPELRGQVWKGLLDQVYASGQAQSGSETAAQFQRRGDGALDTRYLNFAYTPLRNPHGQVDGLLVIASDVTDQVVARREISGLREAAEAANRAKDEFLAMLGPRAAQSAGADPHRAAAAEAARRGRRRARARHHRAPGQAPGPPGRRSARRLAHHARQDRAAAGAGRDSPTWWRGPSRCPARCSSSSATTCAVDVPRTGLTVDADAGRLAQVVANLLTNAAKYTEPGGTIAVTARAEGEEVVLVVRDTGIGIAPEMLPRIFDLFAQERQTLERSQGGLGLGLAIVRSLVSMHGGSVFARSEGQGHGAEFTVRLGRIAAGAAEARHEGGDPVRPVPVPTRRAC